MEVMSSSMVLVDLESVTPARKDPNARRNDVELLFATFGCNFSFAFQRVKERRNPSSYAKVMAVEANATQKGVFGPQTVLELTCTSSCDFPVQWHRSDPLCGALVVRMEVMSSSMVLVDLESVTPARKDSKRTPK